VGPRGRARILESVEHPAECDLARLARLNGVAARRAPACDRRAAEEAGRAEAAEIDGLAVRAVRHHRQLEAFRAARTPGEP
jgi:hypothetical protein